MRPQNAGGFLSHCARWFCVNGLMLGVLLLAAATGHAGVLTASWTAPTTNTDGSALTQLAFYRVYYSASNAPCGGLAYFEVASSTSIPQPDQTVSFQMTGLTTGSIYSVSVTAVDTNGVESACSDVASAVARDDSTTTPVQDTTTPTVQDTTTPVQDTTSPTVQGTTTPTVPNGSATTPNSNCPPGQAKKGRC